MVGYNCIKTQPVSTAQEELGPKFEAVAAAKKRLSSETLEGIQGIRIPARTSFWTHRTSPTKYSGRRDWINYAHWFILISICIYNYIWLGHY